MLVFKDGFIGRHKFFQFYIISLCLLALLGHFIFPLFPEVTRFFAYIFCSYLKELSHVRSVLKKSGQFFLFLFYVYRS